ncbi:hypothetical protein L1987_44058 [Smallanthus sonchifolius]|uniref:Uncharacterized protein n=1 Tax=Smallanthus sonchifolius TaxID=185202 RepID=A0ACB9GN95_9ASTR|nr:hypothetical protein L1987_44058 [Smallanthus sonchifolius]
MGCLSGLGRQAASVCTTHLEKCVCGQLEILNGSVRLLEQAPLSRGKSVSHNIGSGCIGYFKLFLSIEGTNTCSNWHGGCKLQIRDMWFTICSMTVIEEPFHRLGFLTRNPLPVL